MAVFSPSFCNFIRKFTHKKNFFWHFFNTPSSNWSVIHNVKKIIAEEWVTPWVSNASGWKMQSTWWHVDIRVCQCTDNRHIPRQQPSGLPRSQGKSVWAPAVSSCQATWLFHHSNTSRGQRPCYSDIGTWQLDIWLSCLELVYALLLLFLSHHSLLSLLLRTIITLHGLVAQWLRGWIRDRKIHGSMPSRCATK